MLLARFRRCQVRVRRSSLYRHSLHGGDVFRGVLLLLHAREAVVRIAGLLLRRFLGMR